MISARKVVIGALVGAADNTCRGAGEPAQAPQNLDVAGGINLAVVKPGEQIVLAMNADWGSEAQIALGETSPIRFPGPKRERGYGALWRNGPDPPNLAQRAIPEPRHACRPDRSPSPALRRRAAQSHRQGGDDRGVGVPSTGRRTGTACSTSAGRNPDQGSRSPAMSQIDRRSLERAGNVAIDGPQTPEAMAALKTFATAARAAAAMPGCRSTTRPPDAQGGQSEPACPFRHFALAARRQFPDRPAMTEAEILDFIGRFAHPPPSRARPDLPAFRSTRRMAICCRSSSAPRRISGPTPGAPGNRARFLMEAVRATRKAVGADFPVSVKLNSADFQKGGFAFEDSLQVARWLTQERSISSKSPAAPMSSRRWRGWRACWSRSSRRRARSTKARRSYFARYADEMAKAAGYR